MRNRRHPHDSAEWFTVGQAARLTGLSVAMVNYLCRQGIVEPSCGCPRGHGSRRHYAFGELVALRLVSKLSKAGASILRLKQGMHALRQWHPAITLTSLPAKHLVTDGQHIYLRQEGESLERLFDGQYAFAFVIELSQLQSEVIAELKRAAA